jgi:hypothetical protein
MSTLESKQTKGLMQGCSAEAPRGQQAPSLAGAGFNPVRGNVNPTSEHVQFNSSRRKRPN